MFYVFQRHLRARLVQIITQLLWAPNLIDGLSAKRINETGQYKTWTADCGLRTADHGLRTGYKIRTRYKTRTPD